MTVNLPIPKMTTSGSVVRPAAQKRRDSHNWEAGTKKYLILLLKKNMIKMTFYTFIYKFLDQSTNRFELLLDTQVTVIIPVTEL